ncbi:MAG: polysaccharide deacetylase family protein [Acidobacteria bacterium]|nr:MAG: polysaccharide deacetylase family protein [Acidobacteriota bacterium]
MSRSSGAEVRSMRPLVRWAKASKERRLGRQCGENGLKMMWPIVGLSAAVGGALGAFLYYACTVPSSQILGPTLVRGPAEGRRIALTFDDGPLSPFTEQVLDILRERRVPATFFVCGKNVERFPEILRRVHEEGHGLGNHTYSHPFLFSCSRAQMAAQIDRTQAAIEKLTGYRPGLFRPPYGIRWFGIFGLLRERGMQMVQWSATGFDWKLGTEDIVREALKGVQPGAVILLHDGVGRARPARMDRSATIRALPAIIDAARNAGLTFVKVQDFLPVA